MQPPQFRHEVQDFVRAAEVLLSPALLKPELSPNECKIIAQYVMSLSHFDRPWSKLLNWRYT